MTGSRVALDGVQGRLPREERMKGYAEVDLIGFDYPFDAALPYSTPVAVEVRSNSENLSDFEHPADAIYVFGPEDGSLDKAVVRHCHRFVIIPTFHCTNLSAAVYIVLYDRMLKRYQQTGVRPALREDRGFV